jgi:hypothetical protein
MPLNRDEIPRSKWEHRYQLGFLLWDRPAPKPQVIFWHTVSQRKFLQRYYEFAAQLSDPEDILALFHYGDIQRFGRLLFRALRA